MSGVLECHSMSKTFFKAMLYHNTYPTNNIVPSSLLEVEDTKVHKKKTNNQANTVN